MNKRISTSLATLLFIVFCIVVFLFFLRPLSADGDFYHHIDTGRYVWQHHALPMVDTWTFTAVGRPWVAHSWLGGLVLYLIFAHWSFPGIAVLLAGTAMLTFAALFFWLGLLRIPTSVRYAILGLALPVVATRWPDRPEVFAYPLMILLFIVNELRRRRPKAVLAFPLIILLWANLYGANVLVGILILIFLAVVEWLKNKRLTLLYSLSMLVAIGAAFVNGYGARTVFYIANIPQIAQFQGEWAGIMETMQKAPVEYVLTFQYLVLIYLAFVAVFFLALIPGRRAIKLNWPMALLSAGLIFPFVAFRQAPIAAIIVLPMFGLALTAIAKKIRMIVIVICAVVAVVCIALSLWIHPPGLPEKTDPDNQTLISFLTKNHLYGRTYNNQQLGGFLTYYLPNQIKTFVDTRDDLFLGTSVMTDIVSMNNILSVLKKYSIDLVIVDFADGGPIYQPLFYDPNWAPVYLNNRSLVVVTRATAQSKHLPILDAVDPFSENGAKGGLETRALAQYKLGDNPTYIAQLLFATGDIDGAFTLAKTFPNGTGPQAPLVTIENTDFLFTLSLTKRDCPAMKNELRIIDRARRHPLLFTPSANLPSDYNKDAALYYRACTSDEKTAQTFAQAYVTQPDVSILEKAKFQQMFDDVRQAPVGR